MFLHRRVLFSFTFHKERFSCFFSPGVIDGVFFSKKNEKKNAFIPSISDGNIMDYIVFCGIKTVFVWRDDIIVESFAI
jgi:hypothetical protein